MTCRIFFVWYDFWVGGYWSCKDRTLYICLIPCVVLEFKFQASEPVEDEMLWGVPRSRYKGADQGSLGPDD